MSNEYLSSFFRIGDKGAGANISTDIENDQIVRVLFRYMLRLIQISALGGDTDCQEAMEDVFIRAYIKNETASDIEIKYGNFDLVFESGVTYACHPNEMQFFQEKAIADGTTLTEVDQTEWLSTGVEDVFAS